MAEEGDSPLFTRFSVVCFGYVLLCFLLLHPYSIKDNNLFMSVSTDETSYMAHATALAFGGFPDYSREYIMTFPGNYSLGAGLTAAPFVWALSFADRVYHPEIFKQRTVGDLEHDISPFGFALSSSAMALVGLYFLWRACAEAGGGRGAVAVLLGSATTGLPHYIFRSPISGHILEFTGTSALVYAVFAARRGVLRYGPKLWAIILVSSAILYLGRYNDVLLGLIYGTLALGLAERDSARSSARFKIRDMAIFAVCFGLFACGIRSLIGHMTPQKPFDFWMPFHLTDRLGWHGLAFYVIRVWQMFVGDDWGLIYTAPLVLLGIWGLQFVRPRLLAALMLAPLALNFYIAISFGEQGANYGYRYMIFAVLPISVIGLSLWLSQGRRALRLGIVAALSVLPMLCVLVFTSGKGFYIERLEGPWHEIWSIDHFVTKVVTHTLHRPGATIGWMLHPGGRDWWQIDWGMETKIKWLIGFSIPFITWLSFFVSELRSEQWPSLWNKKSMKNFETHFNRLVEYLQADSVFQKHDHDAAPHERPEKRHED